ncbi:hypothetical protein FB45DRAFT_878946 [Roridomyces roridus]|uniref:Uncharacterized protein n=1 Tax=Roridomyces roridus TaxID=1738132 RepID=A0AAD7B053_9AGAR|nr:hypothetical protein FB45DRAFT_878946 [Roridomyces roridus]
MWPRLGNVRALNPALYAPHAFRSNGSSLVHDDLHRTLLGREGCARISQLQACNLPPRLASLLPRDWWDGVEAQFLAVSISHVRGNITHFGMLPQMYAKVGVPVGEVRSSWPARKRTAMPIVIAAQCSLYSSSGAAVPRPLNDDETRSTCDNESMPEGCLLAFTVTPPRLCIPAPQPPFGFHDSEWECRAQYFDFYHLFSELAEMLRKYCGNVA